MSPLYLYVYILESDSIKLLPFFEDFDETSINFNVKSKKKEKLYINEFKEKNIKKKKKDIKKNFLNEYFINI